MAGDELLYGRLFDSCPENWDVVPFEDAIDFQEGPGIMAVDFHDTGVPLIRLSGVQRSTASLDGCNFLDPEKVAKKWNHFRLKRGDLLISTSATIGMVSEIGPETEGAVAYTGLIRLRSRTDKVWPGFIKYFASSSFFIQQAEGMAAGSVLRHFGPSHLRQMAFPIPPLPEQRAIANILGALDDKIELNRRMNETLEGLARAIFQSWFVDFDPVRAQRDGLPPPALSPTTAALFPDSFEHVNGALIPRGWRLSNLGELASNVSETFDFTTTNEVVFVNTGDVLDGDFLHRNRSGTVGLPGQAKKIIRPNDMLFSEIRPANKRFAFVDFDSKEYVVSTKFMVIRAHPEIHPRLLYRNLASKETLAEFQLQAESRSGTFPQITFDSVSHLPIVLPTTPVQTAFQNIVDPLDRKLAANKRQTARLAAIRDALLPKLLSGEIRVADAERLVEDSV